MNFMDQKTLSVVRRFFNFLEFFSLQIAHALESKIHQLGCFVVVYSN